MHKRSGMEAGGIFCFAVELQEYRYLGRCGVSAPSAARQGRKTIGGDYGELTARYIVGATGEGAAAVFDRLQCAVDIVDADIIKSRRSRHVCRSGHDRTDHPRAMVQEFIFAQVAHRHGIVLLPAEHVGVEGDGGVLIGGGKLVPADVLRYALVGKRIAPGVPIVHRRDGA